MCRKTAPVPVDPVNHYDTQLIDLFGAKDHGPEQDVPLGAVFQNSNYDCRDSGSRWCTVLTQNKTQSPSLSAVRNILNHSCVLCAKAEGYIF